MKYLFAYHWIRKIGTSSLIGLLFLQLPAQNLLPDGSFEKLVRSTCKQPDEHFEQSQYWYPLNASPDLFKNNCTVDETRSIFWKASLKSYDGDNFAGISSRWNSNATYVSEGIATPLQIPLEAGKTYFFEMAIRNRGGFQGLDETVARCALKPEQHIDVYLSTDSIAITNDFSFGTASINGRLVAVLNSEPIASTFEGDWNVISTCFEAQAGEKYLAVVMPLGTFGALPPCAAQASSGVFRSFYYHLDDVQLTASPNQIEETLAFCKNESITVNVLELFTQPSLQSAEFIWEDDSRELIREFSEAGIYTLQAVLPCGVIPLVIKLEEKLCEPTFFVPDVFSPNEDGINDTFQSSFPSNFEVQHFNLSIFDRWGNLVFQSNDPQVAWDGTSKNQKLSAGIYLWICTCELVSIKETIRILKSGTVGLMP
jgi:gliding motility-associated-like protein